MKLTFDNMTIEGTLEECYEFQAKIKAQKEKDRIKFIEDMKKERADLIPTYQPPTYIGTPVVPYEPNRIWCGSKYIAPGEWV